MYLRAALIFLLTIVCVLFAVPVSAWDSDLQKRLDDFCRSDYLTLRAPDKSKEIVFDGQGTRISRTEPGRWYENARLQCRRIKVDRDEIVIKGKRVTLLFDSKAANFLNVQTKTDVRIKIGPGTPILTFSEFLPVLNTIFLTATDTLADVAPEEWHACLRGQVKRGICKWPEDPVFQGHSPSLLKGAHVKLPSDVTPPKALYDPDPGYTDAARKGRISGTTILLVAVDSTGKVTHMRILKPLGYGLDDNAVETVRTWTFEPAMKNGTPMATHLHVAVNFHLY